MDSFRTHDGFVVLTYTLLQYVRGGPSFSRGLGRQTFGGGTDGWEKAAQGALGLQAGLHPTRCTGLEMPPEFAPPQLTLLPHPEGRTSLGAEGISEHNEGPRSRRRPLGLNQST